MNKVFNDETLKLARNYLGLSQKDFASRLSVSQALISNIEKSRKPLTEELVVKLKNEFGNYFFNQNIEEPLLKVYYRASATIAKKFTDLFEARLKIIANNINSLLELVEIQDNRIPKKDLEDFELDAEYLAREIREYFGLGNSPIKDLVRLLERNGVIIHFFEYDFISSQNKSFDGVSFYISGVPVILINNKIQGARKMFTLAHELGHLIMHNHIDFIFEKDRDTEKEANIFASEFIAPKRALRGEFSRLTIEKLFSLKSYWKLSVSALLYKAKEMTLSPDQYRRWITRLAPYRRHEPYDIDVSSPLLLRRMIEVAENDFNSKNEFLDYLGLSNELFNEIYSVNQIDDKTKLRIVI
ncbi:MAG: ImmA/IrrE family metallo-endopeptidase [Flavobacterium sp.]|nr:MAG: ImmA/IrrE family metallo-endopeptidase [Flavobacterium sp.]